MTEPCWCGAEQPYYAPIVDHCNGLGTIECECGGDICVCHWHGEAPCPGCGLCEPHDFDCDDWE